MKLRRLTKREAAILQDAARIHHKLGAAYCHGRAARLKTLQRLARRKLLRSVGLTELVNDKGDVLEEADLRPGWWLTELGYDSLQAFASRDGYR